MSPPPRTLLLAALVLFGLIETIVAVSFAIVFIQLVLDADALGHAEASVGLALAIAAAFGAAAWISFRVAWRIRRKNQTGRP